MMRPLRPKNMFVCEKPHGKNRDHAEDRKIILFGVQYSFVSFHNGQSFSSARSRQVKWVWFFTREFSTIRSNRRRLTVQNEWKYLHYIAYKLTFILCNVFSYLTSWFIWRHFLKNEYNVDCHWSSWLNWLSIVFPVFFCRNDSIPSRYFRCVQDFSLPTIFARSHWTWLLNMK